MKPLKFLKLSGILSALFFIISIVLFCVFFALKDAGFILGALLVLGWSFGFLIRRVYIYIKESEQKQAQKMQQIRNQLLGLDRKELAQRLQEDKENKK
jgi:hypothetical protein